MQIDDLPIRKKPFKINDLCLQILIKWERFLHSMEFVKVSKPEPPVDIKNI